MEQALAIKEADREKIQLIKDTVAKGATDLELKLFLHAANRTGLDPLMKQIYAVKRWSSRDKREVMTIQTGIDGYRLIADRTGNYAGSDDPVFEVSQTSVKDRPTKATMTVYKLVAGQRCPFTSSARWEEYVQRNQDGGESSMWAKMPFLMLGKCAEALALRKAFPAELSGIYTTEEMMQADNTEPRPSLEPRREDAAGDQAITNPERISQQASDAPAPSNQDADLATVFQDLCKEIEHAKTIDDCNQVLLRAQQQEGFSVQAMQTINKQVAARMKALRGK